MKKGIGRKISRVLVSAVKNKLHVVLTSDIIQLHQIQGGARYVETFKCLASEFYVLYFSRIDTFRREFLPPPVGYISKPCVGITGYGTWSTWVWE